MLLSPVELHILAQSIGEWLRPLKRLFCKTALYSWLKRHHHQAIWFLKLKAYFEQNELDIVLSRLRVVSLQPEFQLAVVADSLSVFSLSAEELEQLRWFRQANLKLKNVEQSFNKDDTALVALLKDLIVELSYVASADNLYQRFSLQPLQQRVRHMIEQLVQRLDLLIDMQKRQQQQQELRLQLEQEQQLERAKELELQREAVARDKVKEERLKLELELQRQETKIRFDFAESERIRLEMQNRREQQLENHMHQVQQALVEFTKPVEA